MKMVLYTVTFYILRILISIAGNEEDNDDEARISIHLPIIILISVLFHHVCTNQNIPQIIK